MLGNIELPLFPLGTVLFQGCRISLHIFEQRYMAMLNRCRETGTGFGTVLIRQGDEVHGKNSSFTPKVCEVGSFAVIASVKSTPHNTYNVTIEGGPRIQIRNTWEQEDHLLMGFVDFLAEERKSPIKEDEKPLAQALRGYYKIYPGIVNLGFKTDFNDARDVSMRLSQYVSFDSGTKQRLLEVSSPHERLRLLAEMVSSN